LNESSRSIQISDNNISVNGTNGEDKKNKIQIWKLLKYKLFVFGVFGAFFNLILYTLLEPILTDRLLELGVKEKNLGEYFCIQPFVYSFVSIFVDWLLLK
jgi:hypothetical protein